MPEFKFCPHCSGELEPFEDEEQHRMRCPVCGWIHYRNPTAGAAVVLIENGQLLLGKRRDGGWCIPCGHVEWDESIETAAAREFTEETGLTVELDKVIAAHSNFHNPEQHTVGIWFRAHRTGGKLQAGADLVQVAFFPLHKIPRLKFPTDQLVIAQLVADLNLPEA